MCPRGLPQGQGRPRGLQLCCKALQTCDRNPVVHFEPTEAREPLRSINVDDLSTDQKYLYAVCLAVTSDQFHDDLENKNFGNICQSRWLTLANRV